MRSYGSALTTSASFLTLVSENNWFDHSFLIDQRQRAAFASPGLLQRSENAMRRR